jgi:uncharacterized peroxidase-related enzyme
MAHIDLKNDAPGILGLMAYKSETAFALNQLAETILRGPSSLSQGERELIAGSVSYFNNCNFCHRSHAAAAEFCLDRETGYVQKVAQDIEGSDVSPKMKALLQIAKKVHKSGRDVQKEDIAKAKTSGATDEEIHDAVIVAAAFCMFNRYVDGMGTFAPEEGAPYYAATGKRLGQLGYMSAKPTA